MNRRDKKIKNNTFKEKMKIYMGRKNQKKRQNKNRNISKSKKRGRMERKKGKRKETSSGRTNISFYIS